MVKILNGLRIIEGSAFIAAPLAGLALAQMGADVIRFDMIGGGLDHKRWPVTADGHSLFWQGLNKGKRSIAVDITAPQGREIVTRLICAPGEQAGIFLTNLPARGWLGYDALKSERADLIMMSIVGDRRGAPHVDYTVNAAVGFPLATGPEGWTGPIGHVLPAWDCITGQQAALSILAAERHRQLTGEGQFIELALKDMALATLGNLGIIAEATVNGAERPKIGNAIYGAYGQDFLCKDGRRVIVVAITLRQWQKLKAATGTQDSFAELACRIGVDLDLQAERFKHRHEIAAVLKNFFSTRYVGDFADLFDRHRVTWSEYRTFRQLVELDPDCSTENPMFSMVEHPGVGACLTPGTPAAFSMADRTTPHPAPSLGSDTEKILTEIGYSQIEIAKLHDGGIVSSS